MMVMMMMVIMTTIIGLPRSTSMQKQAMMRRVRDKAAQWSHGSYDECWSGNS